MDGEISRETGLFLVRRLGSDQELCATWSRYHLVRDCLRHHDGGLATASLQQRIREQLDQEAVQTARVAPARRWLKPLAGVAVAASVALMAVVAVGPGRQAAQPAVESLVSEAAAPSFTSPQGLVPAPVSQQASLSSPGFSGSRMNAYVLRHYQATGASGGRGFVTFVPIVVTSSAARAEETTDAEVEPAPLEEANSR